MVNPAIFFGYNGRLILNLKQEIQIWEWISVQEIVMVIDKCREMREREGREDANMTNVCVCVSKEYYVIIIFYDHVRGFMAIRLS